jgi:hypothetical protein
MASRASACASKAKRGTKYSEEQDNRVNFPRTSTLLSRDKFLSRQINSQFFSDLQQPATVAIRPGFGEWNAHFMLRADKRH